jgi:hypothetical protein
MQQPTDEQREIHQSRVISLPIALISRRLSLAIHEILHDSEFVQKVGNIRCSNGETLSLPEFLDDESSVFSRLLRASTIPATVLKYFVILVMNMSDEYESRVTDINEYLINNRAMSILFAGMDLDVREFEPRLRLESSSTPLESCYFDNDVLMATRYGHVYTYRYLKDIGRFRIYVNKERLSYLYVIDGAVYAKKYIRRGPGLGESIASVIHSRLQRMRFSIVDTAVMDYWSEMSQLNMDFDRSLKLLRKTRQLEHELKLEAALNINLNDFIPIRYTHITDLMDDTVDHGTAKALTEYAQALEDRDLIRKILNPEDERTYLCIVDLISSSG